MAHIPRVWLSRRRAGSSTWTCASTSRTARDQNLDVFLIAPDGSRTELFTDVGGEGANFTNTVLDDEAVTPITSGWAPFTGIYLPEGNLTVLEGKSLAGTWKLEVSDDERWFTGTLVDWSITASYTSATASGPQVVVTPTSGLVTTEAGGTASFTVRLDNSPTADVTIPVSSSDPTEGTVSASSLVFTSADWNLAQTVTVTGINDSLVDGNVAYTIVLGLATSDDPDFQGLNPTDVSVTNIDNEIAPTKFYVVNDASQNLTYEYNASGGLVESYSLNIGNTAPRGAASTSAGTTTWVVDANRKVYVYNNSGGLLRRGPLVRYPPKRKWRASPSTATMCGSWMPTATRSIVTPTGRLPRTSHCGCNIIPLNGSNTSPKDIVTDGTYLWVLNDSTTDNVFRYTIQAVTRSIGRSAAVAVAQPGSRSIPQRQSDLWIVDNSTDKVYQCQCWRTFTSGRQTAAVTFPLAAGNTNPQGIADPPVPGSELATAPAEVLRDESAETVLAATWDTHPVRRTSLGSHRVARIQHAACDCSIARRGRGYEPVGKRCGTDPR